MAVEGAGWQVGQSIALELDVLLNTLNGYFLSEGLPDAYRSIIQSLPGDWLAELHQLVGKPKGLISLLATGAMLVGSQFESDYGRATLPIRELTSQQALAILAEQADTSLVPGVPPTQAAPDLAAQVTRANYHRIGLDLEETDRPLVQARININRLLPLLKDGSLHGRFWLWLDRFVYEVYLPWRLKQREQLDLEQKRAAAALGAVKRFGQPPAMDWLNQRNSLLRFSEVNRAVREGRVWVYFWVEPFGLEDLVDVGQDFILVSFAEPGLLYQNFQAYAEQVASRAQALADPTRLTILRLIRHFGMVNTEIAQYLGISRPTVSVHARILREAGLIQSEQDGRVVRHKIVPGEIHKLFRDLQHYLDLLDEE